MNKRAIRFENARSAVVAKLFSGGMTLETELRAIAQAELSPREIFLVDRVIEAVLGTSAEMAKSRDLIIDCDDNADNFSFGIRGYVS